MLFVFRCVCSFVLFMFKGCFLCVVVCFMLVECVFVCLCSSLVMVGRVCCCLSVL